MLTAHNLSKAYGLSPILENITFSINSGERVGLIGPNGSGKSTLMRLLTGEESPDSGHITHSPPNLRLGYLAQGFLPDEAQTLGDLLHQTVGDPDALEGELGQLALALAQNPEQEDVQLAYDATLDKLNRADYGRIHPLLATFQLDHLDLTLPVRSLSGGQKTRLALVLILLDEPQLLLLDEPTNHLDIGMLEWLEAWLGNFNGGVLIVSHDRAFLDQTTTRILDLNPHSHTLREYAGNYSSYLQQYLTEQEKHLVHLERPSVRNPPHEAGHPAHLRASPFCRKKHHTPPAQRAPPGQKSGPKSQIPREKARSLYGIRRARRKTTA